jgi:hypothetical protein
MVRVGRAEALVPRSDVSFRLDQKTGNFMMAVGSRLYQWSYLTKEKELSCANRGSLHNNNNNNNKGGSQLPDVLRLQISVALQQKTANFKVAKLSRLMQWSVLTEGKQKNELAQTEFHFIKTIIIIRGGNYSSVFASISALHCSKKRQTSRWPQAAE